MMDNGKTHKMDNRGTWRGTKRTGLSPGIHLFSCFSRFRSSSFLFPSSIPLKPTLRRFRKASYRSEGPNMETRIMRNGEMGTMGNRRTPRNTRKG